MIVLLPWQSSVMLVQDLNTKIQVPLNVQSQLNRLQCYSRLKGTITCIQGPPQVRLTAREMLYNILLLLCFVGLQSSEWKD